MTRMILTSCQTQSARFLSVLLHCSTSKPWGLGGGGGSVQFWMPTPVLGGWVGGWVAGWVRGGLKAFSRLWLLFFVCLNSPLNESIMANWCPDIALVPCMINNFFTPHVCADKALSISPTVR